MRISTGSSSRSAAAAGWLLAVPLTLAAAAHLSRLDQASSVLLLVAGLMPLLWAPALVAAAIGWWARRRALTALSVGLFALLLAWALAGLGIPPAAPQGAATGPGLRLFSANLYFDNPQVGSIAEEIRAAAPEVVALTELSPANAAGLRRSGVLRAYPQAVVRPRHGAFGIGLWSRLPLAETRVTEVAGAPVIRATVLLGGRRLRLYVVHTVAPLGADLDRWREQLAWLDRAARQERDPLVVAGDLNATRWHRGLSRLLAGGLDDAHERCGRGWAATWPGDRRPLPPLLRLDHVLVSGQVGVRAVWEGDGRGSDHLPILTDLFVAGAAAPGAAGPEADGLPSRHGPLQPSTSPAVPLRPPPHRPRALPPGDRVRPVRPGPLPPLPSPLALVPVMPVSGVRAGAGAVTSSARRR